MVLQCSRVIKCARRLYSYYNYVVPQIHLYSKSSFWAGGSLLLAFVARSFGLEWAHLFITNAAFSAVAFVLDW